jgi:hypothetical protein
MKINGWHHFGPHSALVGTVIASPGLHRFILFFVPKAGHRAELSFWAKKIKFFNFSGRAIFQYWAERILVCGLLHAVRNGPDGFSSRLKLV